MGFIMNFQLCSGSNPSTALVVSEVQTKTGISLHSLHSLSFRINCAPSMRGISISVITNSISACSSKHSKACFPSRAVTVLYPCLASVCSKTLALMRLSSTMRRLIGFLAPCSRERNCSSSANDSSPMHFSRALSFFSPVEVPSCWL